MQPPCSRMFGSPVVCSAAETESKAQSSPSAAAPHPLGWPCAEWPPAADPGAPPPQQQRPARSDRARTAFIQAVAWSLGLWKQCRQGGSEHSRRVGLGPAPAWQIHPCPCRRQHPGAPPHPDHWSAAGWLALEKQWEFQDGDSGGSRDCASGGWHVDGAAKRSGSSMHRTSSGILARMPAPPLLPVLSAPLWNAVPAAQGAAAPAAPESVLRSPWLKDSKCHACVPASYLPVAPAQAAATMLQHIPSDG